MNFLVDESSTHVFENNYFLHVSLLFDKEAMKNRAWRGGQWSILKHVEMWSQEAPAEAAFLGFSLDVSRFFSPKAL